jgi:hypothetical protein
MTRARQVEAFLCTAYARAGGGPVYDGSVHPENSDDAPTLLTVAGNEPFGTVDIDIEGTNVRIILPIGAAWMLARRIDDEVRRVAQSPHYNEDSPYWEPPADGAA